MSGDLAGLVPQVRALRITMTPEETFLCSYAHPKEVCYAPLHMPKEPSGSPRSEVPQGTLDLMILKTLDAMGPQHGYGIARRIEQVSEDILKLNEGTVYASLLRLQQQGWISASWGASENNRKAKYYALTKSGRKQLVNEAEGWKRMSAVISRLLRLASQE